MPTKGSLVDFVNKVDKRGPWVLPGIPVAQEKALAGFKPSALHLKTTLSV